MGFSWSVRWGKNSGLGQRQVRPVKHRGAPADPSATQLITTNGEMVAEAWMKRNLDAMNRRIFAINCPETGTSMA
jgi:hypothetical protein